MLPRRTQSIRTLAVAVVLAFVVAAGVGAFFARDRVTSAFASKRDLTVAYRRGGGIVAVGTARIEVSHLEECFGEVLPNAKVATVLTLKNAGTSAVMVHRPKTSCDCTVVGFPRDSLRLDPGQSFAIPVQIETGTGETFRQFALLKVGRKNDSGLVELRLTLEGSHRKSFDISPNLIDFGETTVADTPVHQVLWLTEVPTDRFTLLGVDCETLAVNATFQRERMPDGLSRYRVQLSLDPAKLRIGEHIGLLGLRTTSRLQPFVSIPIQIRIVPRVRLSPSAVAFGTVRLNQRLEESVALVTLGPDELMVTLLDVPPDISAQVDENGTCPVLIIFSRFLTSGVWNKVITLRVQGRSWSEDVRVPCSAFVIADE